MPEFRRRGRGRLRRAAPMFSGAAEGRQGARIALKDSTRDRRPSTLHGRVLRSRISLTAPSVTPRRKPVPFGEDFRARPPFAHSFKLCCRETQTSAKQDPALIAYAIRARPANSRLLPFVTVSGGAFKLRGMSTGASPASSRVFLSTHLSRIAFEARSAAETKAPLWDPPRTGSTSRSPIRVFASAGRSDIPTRNPPPPVVRRAFASRRFPPCPAGKNSGTGR